MYEQYSYQCADAQSEYQAYVQPQTAVNDIQQKFQYGDQTAVPLQDTTQQYLNMSNCGGSYGQYPQVQYNTYISAYNFGLPQYNTGYNYTDQIQSYNYNMALNTSTGPRSDTPNKPIMNDSGIEISPTLPQQSYTSTFKATNESFKCQNVPEEQDDDNGSETDGDETVDDEEDVKSHKKESLKDTSLIKPPKPYLEIIADAVLSTSKRMMQLHEIYHYMEKKYPYFAQNVNRSWRNSVRHNLSLNECFVKAGRGTNGKGNYWRIHALCEPDFLRGNFRRKTFKQIIRTANAAASAQRASNNIQNQHHNQQHSVQTRPNENYLNSNFDAEQLLNTISVNYGINWNQNSSIAIKPRFNAYNC